MRLTLRTLLAYLDKTLEPQDAEALRNKLEQSSFATQLVQRIHDSLANPLLSAPEPDSVHPIEDPNMLSNYLNSTLSSEQNSEVEKACLESAAHLAEAAACHQILTLVLGKPADVSEELRQRIYAMVDANGNLAENERGVIPGKFGVSGTPAIAGEIGPRHSGIEIPGEQVPSQRPVTDPNQGASPADLPPVPPLPAGGDVPSGSPSTAGASGLTPPQIAASVPPVGVDDSGVFQAATKLREQSQLFDGLPDAMGASPAMPGGQPLSELEKSDFYEGDARGSRITPWLISFALVAALLFAISQIFAPLFRPNVASMDDENVSQIPSEVVETESEVETPATTVDSQREVATTNAAPVDRSPAAPADAPSDTSSTAVDATDAAEPVSTPSDSDPVMTDSGDSVARPTSTDAVDTDLPDADVTLPNASEMENAADTADDSDPVGSPTEMPAETIASLPETADVDTNVDAAVPATEGPAMESIDAPAEKLPNVPGDDPADAADAGVATLLSEKALIAVRGDDDDWKLMPAETSVLAGTSVVCGPEYRATFAMANQPEQTVTLVGPTEVHWLAADQAVNLEVPFGKCIVHLVDPGQGISIKVGEVELVAHTESNDAALAFNISHHRALGSDPMVPENHLTEIELISVAGDFTVTGLDEQVELASGSHITFDPGIAIAGLDLVEPLDRLPGWIDAEVDTGSLESVAAADLLELVRTDGSDSLLLSLRVALGFRRNEVAALAGKMMLALGDASAYFGVDGLLSNPKQRLYWSSHLDAIRETVARSVETAKAVRTAISGQNQAMDNADGDTLFRLLTGYSADQLKTGGDAELVAGLESGSIPVRVLASEHLRDISGTTLFFKPEEEVASRREEIVKKWKARLRKESIRYPAAE
ncbi:hypothetical protein NHH03_14665 [Stieleria sp. TO1_6]|uniref:hypothetical protein n=1 Tax=Stieleria tagensis TaxID=2956795 RepID=UPI00209A9F0A|nr:hypothetical protein [Stieleria tagensis]MCO8122988.1 hypothetical protein [Stieleria tagensis]